MEPNHNRHIKWGILGTGGIANQFAKDIPFAKNAELHAVGSRTLESAQHFAEQYSIPHAYGSYDELVKDPEIEAIYVATPHPFHKGNVITCLEAGKAVLCEKPFTVNASELAEVIKTAKNQNLFLMEAMWTRYLPSIIKVREWINDGRIGDVQLIKADFGFRAPVDPESRLFNRNLAGGALLDVGIYPISFASMIFGAKPEKIFSTAQIGDTGVDEQFSAILSYPSGQTASLNGAIRLDLNNDAYIYGTEGYIHIPSFFFSNQASLFINDEKVETFNDQRKSLGYNYEIDEVGQCLIEGRKESTIMPLNESLDIVNILDHIREQWALSYPFE